MNQIKHCIKCGSVVDYRIPEGDNRPRAICTSCGFINYENPRVVVGAVCMHKGQTLMCKRAIEPRRGYWTIPAGFLELNETTSQGAEREAFEEALAKIKTKKLISIFNIPRVGQVQIIYLADMVDGQFGIGEESEEVELCSFEQALAKEIAFPNVREALLHAQKIVEGSETGILEKAYV